MYRTVVQLFEERVKENPLSIAQYSKDGKGRFVPKTYVQLDQEMKAIASALLDLGVSRGDRIAIISDNLDKWLVSDLAILSLGAIDVPRGRDSFAYELEYIIGRTGARIALSENRVQTEKLLSISDSIPELTTIIAFDDFQIQNEKVRVIKYSDLLARGNELLKDKENRDAIDHSILLGGEEDIATIIFTSGTTGNPKGVEIPHRSLIYQVENIDKVAPFRKDQIWLSVLPVWHAFERILQYLAIYETEAIAYSKPIGKIMLYDIKVINPHYIGSVPRIWETVKAGVEQSLKSKSKRVQKIFSFFLRGAIRYKKCENIVKGLFPRRYKHEGSLKRIYSFFPYIILKPIAYIGNRFIFSAIREKLGRNFVGGISGGGAMPREVARFFNAIGINLLDGYGLTETGPVVGTSLYYNTIPGYMKCLDGTEIRIVDIETGKALAAGEKGELLIRGKQLMKGYYGDTEKTDAIIDKDGYLHSGDLAISSYDGWFSIVGRCKDTIVLAGGENVEPVPIEQALANSPYIERAVVVGQDRKSLGALILIDPKSVERYLKDSQIPYINRDGLCEMEEVRALISREVMRCVSKEQGFKSFEEIARFAMIDKPFEVGRELSAKQEIRRLRINEIYKDKIDSLW